jgi:hypothetical protein
MCRELSEPGLTHHVVEYMVFSVGTILPFSKKNVRYAAENIGDTNIVGRVLSFIVNAKVAVK